jgi:flagellin-like protein
MLMQKRGLAPIYTTLIFLAVALSLGIVIMYISENTETSLVCNYDIKLKLLEIGGQEEICLNENQLQFTLENGVEVGIEKLHLVANTGEEVEVVASITKGGIYTATANFVQPFDSVEIVPVILEQGEEMACAGESLEAEDLRVC